MKNFFDGFLSFFFLALSLFVLLSIFDLQIGVINAQNEYYAEVDKNHAEGKEIETIKKEINYTIPFINIGKNIIIKKK